MTLAELLDTLSLSGHNISVEVSVIFPLLYQLRVDILYKVKAKGLDCTRTVSDSLNGSLCLLYCRPDVYWCLVSMSEEEASPATPVQLMIGAVSSGPGTHWVT